MADIEFRSDFTVTLVDHMGSDRQIAQVARVSTGTRGMDKSFYVPLPEERKKQNGLLNMLMRDRHGTPWESGILQFYIEAPIFVTREFFRHRIASYNETSSRYREMEPVFYVPDPQVRPLRQIGKPGAYTFEMAKGNQDIWVRHKHVKVAKVAWEEYQDMLELGVAREVARNVLPLSLYSSFYVTLNLRSLFNFLSLRRVTEDTTVPTFPLWEIDRIAGKMEELASEYFPVAFEVFNKHGRVAP